MPEMMTPAQAPDWLTRHLQAIGAANPDGISRITRASACRTCHRPVLAGLDSDRAGLPTRCAPAALTATGEAVAALLGVTTFRIRPYRTGYALTRRRAADITAAPAAPGIAVLAEHRCGMSLPRDLCQPAAPPPAAPSPDQPPF